MILHREVLTERTAGIQPTLPDTLRPWRANLRLEYCSAVVELSSSRLAALARAAAALGRDRPSPRRWPSPAPPPVMAMVMVLVGGYEL